MNTLFYVYWLFLSLAGGILYFVSPLESSNDPIEWKIFFTACIVFCAWLVIRVLKWIINTIINSYRYTKAKSIELKDKITNTKQELVNSKKKKQLQKWEYELREKARIQAVIDDETNM
jgi:uncharacterized membrane protein